ncbi:peptide chain release factor N(5)-glutamine methyltransferase [Spirochaetia bacterium 38H-sp]|uniref:Release factor glutamine methyltransferase n=1 Tax=Rarispira pelagica TaxID=3141764 RepID=A0ABU9UCR7_9SPIR
MDSYRELITEASKFLKDKGADSPFLDALLLMAYAAGDISKEKIITMYPATVPADTKAKFKEYIEKRARGIPVSYIRKRKEFYGLEFFVDESVLVPRPDTEVIVDYTLKLIRENPNLKRIHDVCTGSGCMAIAIKKNASHSIEMSVSDISQDALSVCKKNSLSILGHPLPAVVSDLLLSVNGKFDIIVSNPPYVTTEETSKIKQKGSPEPSLALDGGKDGLELIRKLVPQALELLSPGGYLIFEHHDAQAEESNKICREAGFKQVACLRDLAGRRRATVAQKPYEPD